MPRFLKFLLPAALFAVLLGFLWRGLALKPSEVPSPLIGKPAPIFELQQLEQAERFGSRSLQGRVWLLNVWASWCVACRVEHPLLMKMARDPRIVFVGMDYKDEPADALAWLKHHGNPYRYVVADHDGRTGIEYGVYGVPETFVIDRDGIIRYKQIGPLTDEDVRAHVLPLLESAGGLQ